MTDAIDKKVIMVFTLILGGPQSDNNTRFCIFCIETKPWYYTIAGEKKKNKKKKKRKLLAIDLPISTTNLFWDKPLKIWKITYMVEVRFSWSVLTSVNIQQ